MDTKRWSVDKNVDNLTGYPQITQAADLLLNNEVVAFPTETVYGLGANALNDQAVAKIFEAKGRPADNPLIIHIADEAVVSDFVEEIPEKAKQLMKAYWPGPLTIILKMKEGVLSEKATVGLSTVGIRMPDHPVALALLQKTNLPIAAPSANSSGRPSPTTAEHVWDDLQGKISGIVDGGPTGVGLESTVLDCTEEIPVILRPGGITAQQIEEVIGKITVDPALLDSGQKPKSPGMKYRHYAPDAALVLVKGEREDIQRLILEKQQEGLKVGVLTTEENENFYQADKVIACGSRKNLDSVAGSLYDTLRNFNSADLDLILSEMFPDEGVGQAIMNRLVKAAGYRIISI